MMCLSQTAGYAIHALSIVAQGRGQLCLIRDIATLSGIPKPYLAKIVSQLSRQGLVAAKRGLRGGIYLARKPEEISLLDVVQAIDGKNFIGDCMLGMTGCVDRCLCPSRNMWSRLREEIRQALGRSTLAQVLERMGSSLAQPVAPETISAHLELSLGVKSKPLLKFKNREANSKQPLYSGRRPKRRAQKQKPQKIPYG